MNNKYLTTDTVIEMLKNVRCDGNIMLEPRLQEYIKKKILYKQDNIKPSVSLEKEFQINTSDKQLIKNFLKGKKDMYYKPVSKNKTFLENENTDNNYTDNNYTDNNYTDNNYTDNNYTDNNTFFPSKTFRENDQRVQKIKKENINNLPINRGMFGSNNNENCSNSYDNLDRYEGAQDFLDSRITSSDFSKEYNNKFNSNNDQCNSRSYLQIEPQFEKNNKYSSEYRKSHDNRLIYDNRMNQNFISNIDKDPRNKKVISNLSEKINEGSTYFDEHNYSIFNKEELQNSTVVRKDLKTNSDQVQTIPFPVVDQNRSSSMIEEELTRGMRDNTRKSYGYRNPQEHYFQYIDSDFQNYKNTVLPFPRGGLNTRMDNKSKAR
jgi:hypothetical protein